mmetsp:Transcript_23183/g.45203  ORF Transcript_23183/g.45203 Transcript_23183/m.45203 type:complete len:357 (-) Transcript_23183:325-1395(-)
MSDRDSFTSKIQWVGLRLHVDEAGDVFALYPREDCVNPLQYPLPAIHEFITKHFGRLYYGLLLSQLTIEYDYAEDARRAVKTDIELQRALQHQQPKDSKNSKKLFPVYVSKAGAEPLIPPYSGAIPHANEEATASIDANGAHVESWIADACQPDGPPSFSETSSFLQPSFDFSSFQRDEGPFVNQIQMPQARPDTKQKHYREDAQTKKKRENGPISDNSRVRRRLDVQIQICRAQKRHKKEEKRHFKKLNRTQSLKLASELHEDPDLASRALNRVEAHIKEHISKLRVSCPFCGKMVKVLRENLKPEPTWLLNHILSKRCHDKKKAELIANEDVKKSYESLHRLRPELLLKLNART